jgi:hypothetical protein
VIGVQELPPNRPTQEELTKDNVLFLSLAKKALKWEEGLSRPASLARSISIFRWPFAFMAPALSSSTNVEAG